MDDTQKRDQLAVERTRLANERTLLAYFRTSLAFAAAAAALLHFYAHNDQLKLTAIALLLIGLLCGGVGLSRFITVNRRLS